MTQERTTGRIAESLRDNNEVFFDILRSSNDRMYRMNRIVLDEAQRMQDENMDLLRQWMSAPTDISGFNNELFATITRRVRRRMELARTVVDDVRDFGAGTRSIWERVTDNARQGANATAQAGREIGATVAREAADTVSDIGEAAEDGARSLRRQARKAEDGLN
jgi:hypothetical protein